MTRLNYKDYHGLGKLVAVDVIVPLCWLCKRSRLDCSSKERPRTQSCLLALPCRSSSPSAFNSTTTRNCPEYDAFRNFPGSDYYPYETRRHGKRPFHRPNDLQRAGQTPT